MVQKWLHGWVRYGAVLQSRPGPSGKAEPLMESRLRPEPVPRSRQGGSTATKAGGLALPTPELPSFPLLPP